MVAPIWGIGGWGRANNGPSVTTWGAFSVEADGVIQVHPDVTKPITGDTNDGDEQR